MRGTWVLPLFVCWSCAKPKEQPTPSPAPASPPSPAVSAPASAPVARPAAASQPTRVVVKKNPWREVTLPAKVHKVKLVPNDAFKKKLNDLMNRLADAKDEATRERIRRQLKPLLEQIQEKERQPGDYWTPEERRRLFNKQGRKRPGR